MPKDNKKRDIFIAPGRKPWPHEMRVAEILALAGHYIEFLEETNLHTADILLGGIEYEIESPEGFSPNTFEHTLKDALKQSPNIIIDSSRIKKIRDSKICAFLVDQVRKHKQIKKTLFITKQGRIIGIFRLI